MMACLLQHDLRLGQPPLVTVVLRHDMPDGSYHFDWMLACSAAQPAALIAFHLDRPLDQVEEGQTLSAQRIKDHRPMYLDFEGPLSGDRGFVRRVATGTVLACSPARQPQELCLGIRWCNGNHCGVVQDIHMVRDDVTNWRINCVRNRRSIQAE